MAAQTHWFYFVDKYVFEKITKIEQLLYWQSQIVGNVYTDSVCSHLLLQRNGAHHNDTTHLNLVENKYYLSADQD